MPRIAVVGSGGAALGEVAVPGLVDLEKRGIDTFIGTSVNAVMASLVGEGRAAELPEVWDEVAEEGRDWFMRPNADVWNGAFSLKPTRRQMEVRKAGQKLVLDTRVGLVDIAKRKHKVVRLNDLRWRGRLDAIIGSATQPLIHERTQFRDRWVVDGGVLHVASPLPRWWEYDEVHYFFCSPVGPDRVYDELPQAAVSNGFEQALAAIDCFIDVVVQRDYRRVLQWAKHPLAARTRIKVYAPQAWGRVGASFEVSKFWSKSRRTEGERMYGNPVFDSARDL